VAAASALSFSTVSRRTVGWLLGAVAVAAFAVALAAPNATAPSSAQEASACDPARAHEAGDFDQTLESAGVTREYLLHVPPAYDGSAPTPLVLLFHGAGGSAHGIADYTGIRETADEAGFIAVMPLGTESAIIGSRTFNFLTFIPDLPDDVAFVDQLLDTLEAELCVDHDRVYSAGLSNGAMISVRLACSLQERIAAVALVAGAYYPPFSPDLLAEPGCDPTRPVPVVAFHGTADDAIPFEGGQIEGFPVATRHIEDEVVPDWAEHNGCSEAPTEEPVTEHVRLVSYGGCKLGADVRLYVIEGGAHLWPGGEESFFPQPDVSDEISANELLWEFLSAHPFAAFQEEPAPTATDEPEPTAVAQPTALPRAGAGGAVGGAGDPLWLVAAIAGGLVALGGAWFVRRSARR